jgi:hypothetical protein
MTNDDIIPAADPTDVLFETQLIEETPAGAMRSGRRVGSRLTFGQPAVYDLVELFHGRKQEPGFEIRSQLDRYEFRLVRLAATLHVEAHSAVSWFEVHVQFANAGALPGGDVIVHDLYPLNVDDKVDIDRTAKISPSLKFGEVSASIGEAGLTTKYVRLEPKITAYGKREPKVYWRYTPGSGSEVAGGVKEMDLIIRRPRGVSVRATIQAKGSGRQWGIFSDSVASEQQQFAV